MIQDSNTQTNDPVLEVERNCSGWRLKGVEGAVDGISEFSIRFQDKRPIEDDTGKEIKPKCPKFYDKDRKESPVCMAPCYNPGIWNFFCSSGNYKNCATVDPKRCYSTISGVREKRV